MSNDATEISVIIQATHDCGQLHKQTLSIRECTYNLSHDIPPLSDPGCFGFALPKDIAAKVEFQSNAAGVNIEGVELKDGWLLCVKCGKGSPLHWG